jgi:hypothetical protein
MSVEFKYKATVRELHGKDVQFFRELIDVTSFKCYGIQLLTAEEVEQQIDRVVGYHGRIERTFTEPFDIQRGHRIVQVKASTRKPLRCWEHIYAEI